MHITEITPSHTLAAKKAASDLAHLAEVERAHEKLTALLGTLRVTDGAYTKAAMWEALEFLECLGFAFDDASEHMDHLRTDLGIDDEGYRLRDDGERGDRVHVPAGRVA